MNCPFGIWLTANEDGSKLVVTKVEAAHNHEVRKVSMVIMMHSSDMSKCCAVFIEFGSLRGVVTQQNASD